MPARRVVGILGANVAQENGPRANVAGNESAGPAIALDEQVFVFLEAEDGVSDKPGCLVRSCATAADIPGATH